MEPQKRGKYSKLLEPKEIEEVLTDEDSDEELEETEECTQSSTSSEDEDNMRKQKLCFELEEPRIHQMSLISLDLLVASIVQ